jgi:hypothetical protein
MSAHRKFAAATLAAGLVLGAAACGGGDDDAADRVAEEIVENAGGGDVEIDSDDNTVKFTDEDGNVSEFDASGEGAELPDGWPEALAPPSSVTIISSSTNTIDGAKNLYVLGEAEGTVDDFLAAIKSQIEGAGYEIVNDSSVSGSDGAYAGISAEGDEFTLTASITDGTEEGTVAITMSLAEPAA